MAEIRLTPEQQAVVDDRGGPLLVSAAAGSGKTKVLVDRLLKYIMDPSDPADVDQFLIITYTKAAAAELRAKIAAKLTETIAEHPDMPHLQRQLQRLHLAKISTVHSFCAEMLREYAFPMELPGEMRTAEENECRELKSLAMEAVLQESYAAPTPDGDFCALVDTQAAGRNDSALADIIEKLYTAATCHPDPRRWLEQCRDMCNTEGITDAAQTPWGDYLLKNAKKELEGQIAVLEKLKTKAAKAKDANANNIPALDYYCQVAHNFIEAKTWDEARLYCKLDAPRLKPVKKGDLDLKERISYAKDAAKERFTALFAPFSADSESLLQELQSSAAAVRGLVKLTLAFDGAYRQEKLRRRVLDFGDLEHKMLELLKGRSFSGPTRAAREIGSRFREIMVDEYQDSNAVQEDIFGTLTGERGNLFMVGDVKQSIYRFRLADPNIFLGKYGSFADYKTAKPGQGRRILLSQNFRSGPDVLEAANDVFRLCMYPDMGGLRYGDAEALRPRPGAERMPTPAVELHCIQADRSDKSSREAQFVAERIARMVAGEGQIPDGSGKLRNITAGDITILLRSPGTGAGDFIKALNEQGIPVSTESSEDILTSDEIGILRALLQVLDNPLQDIPLQAVLASPVFGFTADHIARIRAAHPEGRLYEALLQAGETDAQAADFLTRLESFRQTARLETLARLVEEIYAQTHIDAIFGAMTDGEKRRTNLEIFYEQAVAFEQGGLRDLQQFLAHLERLEAGKGLNVKTGASGGAVQIMSIHSSKGLEYPVVFLCGLSHRFNDQDTQGAVLVDSELGIGCSVLNAETRMRYPDLAKQAIVRKIRAENAAEELRILYVAMTRARDRLIMTYAMGDDLAKKLTAMAARLDITNAEALSKEARSLGHWVLMAALSKTEAGELFAAARKPVETQSGKHHWCIRYYDKDAIHIREQEGGTVEAVGVIALPKAEVAGLLNAQYGSPAAVQAPSKVTATQLKGRNLDDEAADGAFTPLPPKSRTWRKPDFLAQRPLDGREIGTATHLAMQFIRYEACGTSQGIEDEITRLVEAEFITPRQAQAVKRDWIARFFQTDLGRRLMQGGDIHREFKFSILEDGAFLDPDLAGEELLLQGVVDCFMEEPDGLTVLDFKTDRVEPGAEPQTAARYAPQVKAYGKALSRIYDKPVKKLLLYFFRTGKLVEVE